MTRADVVVVGGGIVGLASAHVLSRRHPNLKIVLLEKEGEVAAHQTGRNSGVIHSGIYYKPGSLKAKLCFEGKATLERYCQDHGIAFELCGKVIVAVSPDEIPRLNTLLERGLANGVPCERIDKARLAELEPHTQGVDAVHVASTGIVDYLGVCRSLAQGLRDAGHEVLLGRKVVGIADRDGAIRVQTNQDEVEGKVLLNCAGLYSDVVARMAGCPAPAKIVPFRGEYFELKENAKKYCRNLIYPVPDPSFPFLGVHFTRMVGGGVECGPNAVLAYAREGYFKTTVRLDELAETLAYPGFRRLAKKHWATGMGEMRRSWSRKSFAASLQRLVPEIRVEDLVPAAAGVRAQAVRPDGGLVDDFLFTESDRMVHVINAPSPAATAAFSIGEHIVDLVDTKLA